MREKIHLISGNMMDTINYDSIKTGLGKFGCIHPNHTVNSYIKCQSYLNKIIGISDNMLGLEKP